jgi:hypothetical protein
VAPVPSNAVEWTDRSWRTWRFHQRCKAVGDWPDDAIVRRNAALIESTLEDVRDSRARGSEETLTTLLTILTRVR